MKRRVACLFFAGILFPCLALGADNPLIVPAPNTGREIGECILDASRVYAIPEALIYAIALKESSLNPYALGQNKKSRTEDIGLMQINSGWLPTLNQHGISRDALFDQCVNIHVGAWVLKGNMLRYGMTWRAVGAYNASSKRPDLREKYAQEVRAIMKRYGLARIDS